MDLHDVNAKVRRNPAKKRVGRGAASGWGCTSSRGNNGARARSGWRYKLFREGGQMPLARRIPKRGFNNALFRMEWAFVNLRDLNEFEDGATVTLEACVQKGLVPQMRDGLKVLGHGALEKKLAVVRTHRISDAARKAIEEKGGKVELLKAEGEETKKHWKETRGKGKSTTRRNAAKDKAAAQKGSGQKK